MSNELQTIPALDAMPSQADTDAQVVALWIHGRSRHTQRAYRANAGRFLVFAGKPLAQVSLGDIQAFGNAPTVVLAQSSQAQALAAVKSLLAFAHKIGYIPSGHLSTGLSHRRQPGRNVVGYQLVYLASGFVDSSADPNGAGEGLFHDADLAGALRITYVGNGAITDPDSASEAINSWANQGCPEDFKWAPGMQ